MELREQRISGTAYRHFVFNAHYRQQLNMGDDSLEQSRSAVRRIGTFARRLREARGGTPALADAATRAESTFMEALFDDLNAPRALAVLGEKDQVTSARDATRLYERVAAGGAPIEVWRVAGAHAFDEADSDLSWYRYDRDLAAASIERFRAFVAEALSAA